MKTWHRACFVWAVFAAWTAAAFVDKWNDGTIQKIRVNPTLLVPMSLRKIHILD
jgi:hypothetical protein